MTTEDLIRECTTLGYPASLTEREVTRHLTEKIIRQYIDANQTFEGKASIPDFRNFIEHAIRTER